MSDVDDPPPSKVSKIESVIIPEDMAGQDNGQEEWLSEGVLTDDGFDATEQMQMSNADNFSQDELMHSADGTVGDSTHFEQSMDQDVTQERTLDQTLETNIRQLSETQASDKNQDDGTQLDSISEYLVKKPREERESEGEEGKAEQDDGNNTDELLEMLGEEKKLIKQKQVLKKMSGRHTRAQLEDSSDDEDLDSLEAMVRQGAKITMLKVAPKELVRKYMPKKALPEASDSEMSTDDGETMKNVFKPRQSMATRSATKPSQAHNPKSLLRPGATTAAGKSAPPSTGKANSNSGLGKSPTTSTPLKQYSNRKAVKPGVAKETQKSETQKAAKVQKTGTPKVPETKKAEKKVIQVEEALGSDEDAEWDGLQLRKPEQMDEDMLSEDDSEFDEDDCSFYNELPSSDSEDIEEWFALDVRAERAGDYIPLLGNKAFELLTEEKKRVEGKLSSLRSSIAELAQRRKDQTAQIEAARRTLAELDTLLAHS